MHAQGRATPNHYSKTMNDITPELVKNNLKHIAFIMDGNGRWATSKGLDRVKGHEAGAKAVDNLIGNCIDLGVRHITLYAFSSENWKRPQEEINALMQLFIIYVNNEKERLLKNGVRVRLIGDRSKLTKDVITALNDIESSTVHGTTMDLILAISYGSRDEIVTAIKNIATRCVDKELSVDQIDEECFSRHLFTKDIPDPDLLVRTSGEQRISNFLLWQLAYSELIFVDCFWPDFNRTELENCIRKFLQRERRFGGIGPK